MKQFRKFIALGMIICGLLTGCQHTGQINGQMPSKEISGQAPSTESLTNEVKYTKTDDNIDVNIVADSNYAYTDTDFSTPEDYDRKSTNIDYGLIDDNVTYYSTAIGEEKKCGVLLPPLYTIEQTYPVVYLLHGFGGSHNDWCGEDSYVRNILGNMIAKGTAVQAIIVMPDMYTAPAATKENATEDEMRTAYDNLVNDLENDLMPYIESHYSVKSGRENTGIIGISQGGTESLAIGFKLQDKIGYIGTLAPCPGVIPTNFYVGTFWNIPILEDFIIEDKKNTPYYVQLTVGDQDPWCLDSTKYYDEILTQKNIAHSYYLLKNYTHDTPTWKNGIYNFFKRVFK